MRRIRATADGAARKFAGVDGLTVSTGPRRVQTVAKASRCTPADLFVARRRDDAPGSNSIHGVLALALRTGAIVRSGMLLGCCASLRCAGSSTTRGFHYVLKVVLYQVLELRDRRMM